MGYLVIVVFCSLSTPENECDVFHLANRIERLYSYTSSIKSCVQSGTLYAASTKSLSPKQPKVRVYCVKAEYEHEAYSKFLGVVN